MDFITGLPRMQGKDCIFVVVDRLMKFSHFFSIATNYNETQVVELFFREIFSYPAHPRPLSMTRIAGS
jgi:hypothetical protein